MGATCFKLTEYLTNKEFINFKYLWHTSDTVEGVAKPSCDYPYLNGVAETNINVCINIPKRLCDRLRRSKYCHDCSNNFKMFLSNFCCFTDINICNGLACTCTFNECLDIMDVSNDNPHRYNVYLLLTFTTDGQDDNVGTNAQIDRLSNLLKHVKQKATVNIEKRISFLSDIQ